MRVLGLAPVLAVCVLVCTAGVSALERHSARGPVEVFVRLTPEAPLIGDLLDLEIEARAEEGVELLMPEFGEALDRFLILDFSSREDVDPEGRLPARAARFGGAQHPTVVGRVRGQASRRSERARGRGRLRTLDGTDRVRGGLRAAERCHARAAPAAAAPRDAGPATTAAVGLAQRCRSPAGSGRSGAVGLAPGECSTRTAQRLRDRTRRA